MVEYTQKIREIARRLLQEKKVDVFIGYGKGSVPMMNEPILIRDPADAERLHWDSHCGLNLCNYLTRRTDRVGIVANGCTSRNIITHIVENQVQREQLFIVGIPCTGMVEHRAVVEAFAASEILDVGEEGDSITVSVNGAKKTLRKADLLRSNCALCTHRNPVEYDEMVADPVAEKDPGPRFEDVETIEKMTPEEKRRHFAELVSPCIRCYACRNACPLCYCPTCFVDESRPQWVGKSADPVDTMTFHFLRAYHCAGRCTDCGACERVCPVSIPVREFTRKLNKDALELFGWEAGLDRNQRPPLDFYKVDDYNDFVK